MKHWSKGFMRPFTYSYVQAHPILRVKELPKRSILALLGVFSKWGPIP